MGNKQAKVVRMVMEGHLCPWGLKVVDLLEREGFEVEDRHLESKQETEAFKREWGVETTPQVWIDGERVGGYEAVRARLGDPVQGEDEVSYWPVGILFAVAAATALAFHLGLTSGLEPGALVQSFVALSMTLLALLKLQDVEGFSVMFLNYDLLARRWVRYASLYPWLEATAGLLMLGRLWPWLSAPLALLVGGVGAVSVFKAVYVDGRELKCACVGSGNSVPLGFVSLTENLMMLGMGAWTAARALG